MRSHTHVRMAQNLQQRRPCSCREGFEVSMHGEEEGIDRHLPSERLRDLFAFKECHGTSVRDLINDCLKFCRPRHLIGLLTSTSNNTLSTVAICRTLPTLDFLHREILSVNSSISNSESVHKGPFGSISILSQGEMNTQDFTVYP